MFSPDRSTFIWLGCWKLSRKHGWQPTSHEFSVFGGIRNRRLMFRLQQRGSHRPLAGWKSRSILALTVMVFFSCVFVSCATNDHTTIHPYLDNLLRQSDTAPENDGRDSSQINRMSNNRQLLRISPFRFRSSTDDSVHPMIDGDSSVFLIVYLRVCVSLFFCSVIFDSLHVPKVFIRSPPFLVSHSSAISSATNFALYFRLAWPSMGQQIYAQHRQKKRIDEINGAPCDCRTAQLPTWSH